MTQLIKTSTSSTIVSAASFCSRPVTDDQVSILFRPGGIQSIQNPVMGIQELPDGTNVTAAVVADDCLCDVGVGVRCVWNVVAQVVFGDVFGSVVDQICQL